MSDPLLTPEEKLLRIIESPPQAVRSMRPPGRKIQDTLAVYVLLFKRIQTELKSWINLRTCNVFLAVVMVGVTVYLVIDFWLCRPLPEKIDIIESNGRSLSLGNLTIEQISPVDSYVSEIAQRNMFSLPPPPVEQVVSDVPLDPNAEIKTFAEGLQVIGIIWSETTPQVILEDTKNGGTFLLNNGGRIRNIRVKEILKDRVVLGYDTQELELLR